MTRDQPDRANKDSDYDDQQRQGMTNGEMDSKWHQTIEAMAATEANEIEQGRERREDEERTRKYRK